LSHEISAAELRQRLDDPSLHVVDVLPPESYATAHIPGAISLPVDEIAARARAVLPDLSAEIAVYCARDT
jgi:rhodanese-related sulfurtransferase